MQNLVSILQAGGIGVLATDTLYGIVGRAESVHAVERIYRLKGRRPDKPLIILVASLSDVARFGVEVSRESQSLLASSWPGPVSIILPCPDPEQKWSYLHRGTNTLAFRMPKKPFLRRLITQTGPLVAPSANPEGLEPAKTITQAKAYFESGADFYRSGRTNDKPSRLIKISPSGVEVLRP